MPPATRPVSGDAAAACVRQWLRIADAVEEVPDRAFDIVTSLPGWRVADLVAHLISAVGSVARRVGEPAPPAVDIGLADYLLALPAAASEIVSRERASADSVDAATQKRQLRAAVTELVELTSRVDLDRIVLTRFGGMALGDFIATRCVEGVVHQLDLVSAVPSIAAEPDREALKITTRALLRALATKAPGRSVEVRVPPIAAIQCVEGPRHTRGTPANVVETDPLTWIALASGRLAWREPSDDGRLRASGERSDISGLLPLI